MKLVKHMHFKIIRESNIYKIMASLEDQKINFEPFLCEICPYKLYKLWPWKWVKMLPKNPEKWSKWSSKRPWKHENGTKKWLDTLTNYGYTLPKLIELSKLNHVKSLDWRCNIENLKLLWFEVQNEQWFKVQD